MISITKPNCNLCTEERLNILKKLSDKRVTPMKKSLDTYGARQPKNSVLQFFLRTYYPVNK